MTGFEPRTSVIGSDRSTNWATTTALVPTIYECAVQSICSYRVLGNKKGSDIVVNENQCDQMFDYYFNIGYLQQWIFAQ